MPPLKQWGNSVWAYFHTLCAHIPNDNIYMQLRNDLFAHMLMICKCLPCPNCAADATRLLLTIKIADCDTLEKFRGEIYMFHNKVNAKLRKPMFNSSELVKYKQINVVVAFTNFMANFNTKGNIQLLTESFQRNIVKNSLNKWFYYTYLPLISSNKK